MQQTFPGTRRRYLRSLDRNMFYADGAFKLAHVEGPNGLPCLLTLANARAHQVRLKEVPLSRKGKGRCQVRNAIAVSAPTSGLR